MANILNTTLSLGYASFPIALFSARESKEVTLGRASAEGNKIKRVEVDAASFQEEVDEEGNATVHARLVKSGEIKRGRWDGDVFHEIPAEQVEALDERSRLDGIEIMDFIPLKEVPWERTQSSYFVLPQKDAGTRVAVDLKALMDAMKKKKVAAIFRLCPQSKQSAAIMYVKNGALLISRLAYAEEFEEFERGAGSFESVKADAKAVEMGTLLIDAMTTEVSALNGLRDEVSDARAILIEQALQGEEIERPEPRPVPVATRGSLTDALAKSIEQAEKSKASSGKARSARKRTPQAASV